MYPSPPASWFAEPPADESPGPTKSHRAFSLLAGASILGLAAAEGINCEGNRRCSAGANHDLSKDVDLIDEFYQALANGASDVIVGRSSHLNDTLPAARAEIHCVRRGGQDLHVSVG